MHTANITCLSQQRSLDGSLKFLWQLADGKTVESVYFLFPHEGQERPFLCISSQDGCNVGCAFCATGQQPMQRNLTAGEICAQVSQSMDRVRADGGPATAFHIAFAGMGEPLLNYENVLTAATCLHSEGWAEIISVSTSGIVPRIYELTLAKDAVNALYISLHATTDALRNHLVPMNRKYPIAQVLEAARAYAGSTGRKVIATYLVFSGLNDSDEDLQRLIDLLHPDQFTVQLSVWNHIDGLSFHGCDFVPSPRIDHFYETLVYHGFSAFIQRSKGRDIRGGCGQLRSPLPLQILSSLKDKRTRSMEEI